MLKPFRLFLAACLIFIGSSAFASFPPSPPTGATACANVSWPWATYTNTAGTTITKYCVPSIAGSTIFNYGYSNANPGNSWPGVTFPCGNYSCLTGSVNQAVGTVQGAPACSPNSTLSGGSCTCTAPYIENSTHTACVAPPSPDEQACKNAADLQRASLGDKFGSTDVPGSVSSGSKVCIPTPGTSNPASVGCTMNFSRDITITTSDGKPVSQGWVDFPEGFSTAPCSLDVANPTNDPLKPTPAKESLCPAGQQMGQINGVDSCQPYGTGTTTTTDKTGSNSTTDSNGTTTQQKDSTTVCVNGNCTTTETTTTTNTPTGSTTSTTTSSSTSKTEGKDDFCRANPVSKECDSTGSGGTAEGQCRPGDKSAGCAELGGIPGATPVDNVNKAMTITKDTGWGASNGTCPAPQVLNLALVGTVEIPWDALCSIAIAIRPIVLGIAYLTAAFTFFGIGRKS